VATPALSALAGDRLMYLLGERPLTHEEQLAMRDHLQEVGRVVSFVVAVNLSAAAGCFVVGTALAHFFNAINAARNRARFPGS
jgi:hypothetical protein